MVPAASEPGDVLEGGLRSRVELEELLAGGGQKALALVRQPPLGHVVERQNEVLGLAGGIPEERNRQVGPEDLSITAQIAALVAGGVDAFRKEPVQVAHELGRVLRMAHVLQPQLQDLLAGPAPEQVSQ